LKAWLSLCAVLAGGAAAVAWTHGLASPFDDFAGQPLAWRADAWAAHPWTLWTAAWVHTSLGSLAGNLLALAALAVVGAAAGAGRLAALALALAWPLTTLALLAWPDVSAYAGLGGTIYAAAAVLGVHIARRTPYRPMALLLFGGLGIKLAAERGWSQPVAFDPSWGFNVVYAAHLAGALVGAWCALVVDRLLAPPPPGERS
jgi:membrane associated rhomboid family serine protease